MKIPRPPFTRTVTLYCPVHGGRFLRTPTDVDHPFPDPAVCGYPDGPDFADACQEHCTTKYHADPVP